MMKVGAKKVIVAGGVSANSKLRSQLYEMGKKRGSTVYFPAMQYCMDNAAMIGAAAVPKLRKKKFANLYLNAFSTKGLRKI